MERVEVGIRELRLNLSRYVARVRQGAEVIVTDRGIPVARLGPVEDSEDRRARLIRAGVLTPAKKPKSTMLPPPVPLIGEGPLVSERLLEDRR
jgi:prevent-host-death family protein